MAANDSMSLKTPPKDCAAQVQKKREAIKAKRAAAKAEKEAAKAQGATAKEQAETKWCLNRKWWLGVVERWSARAVD